MSEEEEDFDPAELDGGMDAYETAAKPTRAWILHPDIRSESARRLPEHRLAEAVSLAAALPGMEVLGAEVVRLSRVRSRKFAALSCIGAERRLPSTFILSAQPLALAGSDKGRVPRQGAQRGP